MKSKLMSLFVLFISVFSGFRADAQEGNREGKVLVELPRRITKGFPMVLRITVHGPLTVSKTSLFDDTGDVRVHFKSNTDGTAWTIAPYRPRELLALPDGSIIAEVSGIPQVVLAKGEKHAMLSDVASLGNFDDIPPGEYSMTVEFPLSIHPPFPVVTSEPVGVQLIEPSAEEAEYLETVRGLGLFKRGQHGVNWSGVLRGRVSVPGDDMSKLRAEAKDQMEFHVLLSKALRSEIKSREEAKMFPVPEYLQLEKECLLLELDADSGKPQASVSQKEFSDKHPELKWRFQDKAQGFLRFRKTEKNSH